jgi:hypothetical protein
MWRHGRRTGLEAFKAAPEDLPVKHIPERGWRPRVSNGVVHHQVDDGARARPLFVRGTEHVVDEACDKFDDACVEDLPGPSGLQCVVPGDRVGRGERFGRPGRGGFGRAAKRSWWGVGLNGGQS